MVEDDSQSISRNDLYELFRRVNSDSTMDSATFGKIVRIVHPNITTRRLGRRGNSKYHYQGIKVRDVPLKILPTASDAPPVALPPPPTVIPPKDPPPPPPRKSSIQMQQPPPLQQASIQGVPGNLKAPSSADRFPKTAGTFHPPPSARLVPVNGPFVTGQPSSIPQAQLAPQLQLEPPHKKRKEDAFSEACKPHFFPTPSLPKKPLPVIQIFPLFH